jgi:hypothetical protein
MGVNCYWRSRGTPGRRGVGQYADSRARTMRDLLIDQGRRSSDGKTYKTRNNTMRANEMTFEGAACAGGTSDTKPGDENFAIITDGNNRFDGNTYPCRTARRTGPLRVGTRRHRLGRIPAQRPGTQRPPRPSLTAPSHSTCRESEHLLDRKRSTAQALFEPGHCVPHSRRRSKHGA